MVFLPFLMFVAVAVGDVYVWRGGSMNFSDTANWAGGYAPPVPASSATTPCSITFGGSDSIISQLDVRAIY